MSSGRREESATATGLGLNAASARYVRGLLVGGDAGRELVASTEEYFRAEGLHDPRRLAAVFGPDLDIRRGDV